MKNEKETNFKKGAVWFIVVTGMLILAALSCMVMMVNSLINGEILKALDFALATTVLCLVGLETNRFIR